MRFYYNSDFFSSYVSLESVTLQDDYTTDLKSAFRAAVGLKNTKGKNENKEVKVVKKKAKVKGKPRNRLGQRERRRSLKLSLVVKF